MEAPLGVRARSQQKTRQALIFSARLSFEMIGYTAATLRDIAFNAERSTGAMYANFDSKDELWEATFGQPYVMPEKLVKTARELLQRVPRAGMSEQLLAEVKAFLEQSAPVVAFLGGEDEAGQVSEVAAE